MTIDGVMTRRTRRTMIWDNIFVWMPWMNRVHSAASTNGMEYLEK